MFKVSLTLSVFLASMLSLVAGVTAARAQPAGSQPAGGQPASEPGKAPDASQPTEDFVYVTMATSMGDITLELDKAKAPISVENFMKYVDDKFYDGTVFHRVINGFMIQGGGFTEDLTQKQTRPPIKNEWQNGLKNKRGTIAMARQGDGRPNPKTVDSATSQFFINVRDNDGLDVKQPDGGAYAVFGRVVEGMDVVDKIKAVATGAKRPFAKDVPVETITIKSVTRLTDDGVKDLKGRLSGEATENQPKSDGKTDPKPAPKA
jgi:peptidyl-prolyl cis-trans isomerase A (cyclophilin A)